MAARPLYLICQSLYSGKTTFAHPIASKVQLFHLHMVGIPYVHINWILLYCIEMSDEWMRGKQRKWITSKNMDYQELVDLCLWLNKPRFLFFVYWKHMVDRRCLQAFSSHFQEPRERESCLPTTRWFLNHHPVDFQFIPGFSSGAEVSCKRLQGKKHVYQVTSYKRTCDFLCFQPTYS